jgi:hypothetical protein
LKSLKKDLKELNTRYFQGIPKMVEDARNALDAAQKKLNSNPLNTDLIEDEKGCLSSLEVSKASWIQLGDSNAKFFHADAKE